VFSNVILDDVIGLGVMVFVSFGVVGLVVLMRW